MLSTDRNIKICPFFQEQHEKKLRETWTTRTFERGKILPSPLAYFICKNEIFLIKHKSYNIVVDVSVANYLIFQILKN